MKKHNFSAGPSILPREVIEKTAQAVLDFNGSTLSILEISHRSKDFEAVSKKKQLFLFFFQYLWNRFIENKHKRSNKKPHYMDIKDIQNLIRFVSKAEVAEVSIKQDDIEIKIKTLASVPAQVASQQIYVPQAPVAPIAAPQASAAAPANNSTTSTEEENSNLITVKSPMIGTFYRSAGPGKEPFINVGDAIAPGKVLCIVEAMKLFNEIESEVSGKIVKILVDDASPVEYDQPLFLVDPA